MLGIEGYVNGSESPKNYFSKEKEYSNSNSNNNIYTGELKLKDLYISCNHSGRIQKDAIISLDKKLHLVLYGEIYVDSPSDINQLEYIIEKYKKFGLNFLSHLNGSFSLILVDENKDEIIIANDRMSTRPIYYSVKENNILFSSNFDIFLKSKDLDKSPDWAGIIEIITQGFTTDIKTILKDVKMLDYASMIVIHKNNIEIKKYWDFNFDENESDLGESYYRKKLEKLIKKSVERCTNSENNYGLFLSGGFDSRVILANLDNSKSVNLYSFGTQIRYNDNFGDVQIAKKLANTVNRDFIFKEYNLNEFLKILDDVNQIGGGLSRALPEWPIHSEMREEDKIEVILTGDEVFGRFDFPIIDHQSAMSCSSIYKIKSYPKKRLPFSRKYFTLIENISKIDKFRLKRKCKYISGSNQMDMYFMKDYMITCIGRWRTIMSSEFEVRNPFYDSEILDFIKKLPVKYRRGKKLFKKTVKSTNLRLFEIPIARSTNKPESIDWEKWIINNASGLESELFDNQTIIDKIIDEDKIRNYINSVIKNHKDKKSDSTIYNSFAGGRAKQNWLNTRSDENLFILVNKIKSFFHTVRNLITQDPLFPPKTPMIDYIINIIRLRKSFKSIN